MRKYLLIIGFLLVRAGISFAQEPVRAIPRQVLVSADEMPEFPGGSSAMVRFISKQIKYPGSAVKKGIEGQVLVRFIVEPDGTITGHEILRSLDPDCDKEALRVLRKMPRWKPGRHQGAFVAVYSTIPFMFLLN